MTRLSEWALPPRVWSILASFFVGTLALALVLSYWIASNETQAAAEREKLQREQDQAMCAMISVFLSGPEPVAGPNGERSRSVRKAMNEYRLILRCGEIQPPVNPGPARS